MLAAGPGELPLERDQSPFDRKRIFCTQRNGCGGSGTCALLGNGHLGTIGWTLSNTLTCSLGGCAAGSSLSPGRLPAIIRMKVVLPVPFSPSITMISLSVKEPGSTCISKHVRVGKASNPRSTLHREATRVCQGDLSVHAARKTLQAVDAKLQAICSLW